MNALKTLSAASVSLLCVTAGLAQNAQTTVSVDAKANQHSINPGIYGVSFGSTNDLDMLNAPLNRWGGNSTTRYNWQIDAHSAGADWYFETYPDSNGTLAGWPDSFISTTRAEAGAEPLLTVPMIDWLANLGPNRTTLEGFSVKKYGPQTATDPYNPDAGNGISKATGEDITGNNPKDTGVPNSPNIQQSWIQYNVKTYGPSTTSSGIKYYLLDNEPSLWDSTHRDVHPNPVTYAELLTKLEATIKAIRAADPNAKIGGFEEWTWWAMYESGFDQKNGISAANSDYNTHNKTYYYPWLLQQLYAYQKSSGVRMLDMLTAHCYNQAPANSDDSATGQQIRNQETRILWDPNYVSQSWMGGLGINGGVLDWIPTMKAWLNQYYPGLEIGCTEYNWGDEPNLNGATAQADVLGIYGREGLDFATRWTVAENTSTTPPTPYVTYLASQIYRNYDGEKSGFGDNSVYATVADPDNLSAFAAQRSSDDALTLMVINKQQGSTPVVLNVANWKSGATAQVWQINSASQTSITQLGNATVTNNQIWTTVPSQSITLFVIPGNGPVAFGSAATVSPSTVVQGKSTNINITLTSGQTISNANILLQIFDSKNNKVASNTWSGQNLTAGASVPLAYTWSVPAGQTPGNYSVQLGVFNSGWSDTYYWNAALSTVTVSSSANSGPPVFTSSGTATPNSQAAGKQISFAFSVTQTSGANLVAGNVLLQVFDAKGNTVLTNVWSSQNFSSNETESYTYDWTVPSTLAAGSYTAELGVFNSSWSTDYYWNADLASITITSGGGGVPQFTSSGTASRTVLTQGLPTSFSITVQETGGSAVSNSNVELQVFDSKGNAVMTNVWSGQNFSSGQSQTYSYNWDVPASVADGSYTAELGVFDSGWKTNYSWNGNLASIIVSIPGDVNGDGVVNCADIAVVKTAFGTQVGQPGYNANADVNNDGVVNIIDESIVARHLPSGTRCQ